MTPKRFTGKALYEPSGKAKEYSPWAVNFHTGCSNDCGYCYCKMGVLAHTWSDRPKLKAAFRDEQDAYERFRYELNNAILDHPEIKRQGILFSFTTDPMLPETKTLTLKAADWANYRGVPVKILTKRADFLDDGQLSALVPSLAAFGFTLTGADELEPNASSNAERIEAMRRLHEMGFKTFASIEPVITPVKSHEMIRQTLGFSDLYKVGLISGAKKDYYDRLKMKAFYAWLTLKSHDTKIYLKDSFLKYLGLDRDRLPKTFVNSDYNIFKQ